MNLADAMERAQVLDFELQKQLVPLMRDMVPLPGERAGLLWAGHACLLAVVDAACGGRCPWWTLPVVDAARGCRAVLAALCWRQPCSWSIPARVSFHMPAHP